MNAPTIARSQSRTPRKGAALVLVTLLMTMLFALCAFCVDTGNIINAKTTLMAAADAAALATAGEMTGAESYDFDNLRATANSYALVNVPSHYGNVITSSDVCFGVWDPDSHTFSVTEMEPNAVKVIVQRSQVRDNALPYIFGRLFGHESADVSAEAIAVGAPQTEESVATSSVYVTSSKDLSNVVLLFDDGTTQKFDDLSGYTGTFQGTGDHEDKVVEGVWIKSGCNSSGDGSGFGEFLEHPGDDTTVHGAKKRGCKPHVTATFQSTGAIFMDAGSLGPVRLVK